VSVTFFEKGQTALDRVQISGLCAHMAWNLQCSNHNTVGLLFSKSIK